MLDDEFSGSTLRATWAAADDAGNSRGSRGSVASASAAAAAASAVAAASVDGGVGGASQRIGYLADPARTSTLLATEEDFDPRRRASELAAVAAPRAAPAFAEAGSMDEDASTLLFSGRLLGLLSMCGLFHNYDVETKCQGIVPLEEIVGALGNPGALRAPRRALCVNCAHEFARDVSA